MIVDNGVRGDSRVVKTAQSAAEAGHEVILVGRRVNSALEDDFELRGGAQVRLVAVPFTLLRGVRRVPGRSLLRPLGYGSAEQRAYKVETLDLRKSLLQEKWNRRALGHGVSRMSIAWTKGRLLLSRAWFRLRDGQFKRQGDRRSDGSGALQVASARVRLALDPQHGWRTLDPLLGDYEIAYGPVIDELAPDLIHAHDFRMIGVAVRAAQRARVAGRQCAVVYDAHEYMPGVRKKSRVWQLANIAQERAYIGRADRVITVSGELAQMLQDEHGLAQPAAVVLNAPELAGSDDQQGPEIRRSVGLPDDVPLVVYHGSPARQRGLEVLVRALAELPGYHAALVLPEAADSADYLVEPMREAGVTDRVHFLPFVPHDQVVGFLASADVGVIPIEHDINHEISLITKFFDYAQARLPIVVSDVREMSRTVTDRGIGTVFVAGDAADAARAIREAYEGRTAFSAAYTPELLAGWTWDGQVDTLLSTYREAAPWLT